MAPPAATAVGEPEVHSVVMNILPQVIFEKLGKQNLIGQSDFMIKLNDQPFSNSSVNNVPMVKNPLLLMS